MAKNQKLIFVFFSALLFSLISVSKPANACLSCGCGTTGASTDLGVLGSTSGIFAKDKRFLLQFGSSFRNINGSFNELGIWNPNPVESQLISFQNILGIMYFPTQQFSIGLQLPVVTNYLSKATWGSFGSIAPTDSTSGSLGLSLGDIGLNFTNKFFEIDDFALSGWIGTSFPTGQVNGKPENVSGSGIYKLLGGLTGIQKIAKFEILGELGFQKPFSTAKSNTIGDALIYQLQANYQLTNFLRLGLGLDGYTGSWALDTHHTTYSVKLEFLGTAQYDFSMYNGIGIGAGYVPRFSGQNSTTDISMNLVFYQYM